MPNTTIYKVSSYVNWRLSGTGVVISGGGGSVVIPPAGLDGGGVAGQVAYWLDNDTLTGDDNFVYEVDSAGRGTLSVPNILGIGDSAGENTELHLWGDTIYISASSATGNSTIIVGDITELLNGYDQVFIQTPLADVIHPDGSTLNLYSSNGYTGGGMGGSLALYSGIGYVGGLNGGAGGNINVIAGAGYNETCGGGSITIRAGSGSVNNLTGIGEGGNVEIISGGASNDLAGDILIYTGKNDTNNVRGFICFGDGTSFGCLPAKTSETDVVCYDPVTGKLSYAGGTEMGIPESLMIAYSVAL